MTQFFQGIGNGAPLWVWPLLAGLILLGVLSARDRQTPLWLILCLPLMVVTSLNSIAALPHAGAAWGAFAVGYVAGVALGYARQIAWVQGFAGRGVQLRGEWFTLLTLMVIFWANFVGGTVKAVAPAAYDTHLFIAALAACVGAAGGTFLGRALRIVNLHRAQSV